MEENKTFQGISSISFDTAKLLLKDVEQHSVDVGRKKDFSSEFLKNFFWG